MLNDKQKILNHNDFLNERKNARIVSNYEKSKRSFFILSIIISIAIIGTIYLLLDVSNIVSFSVKGNVYLDDDAIISLSGLSTSNKFLFTNVSKAQNNIKSNIIIDDCKLSLLDNQTVQIDVKEKKIIGYGYEDGNNVLILEDDSRFVLDKRTLYLIGKVPLIEGFNKDQILLLEKNLKDIDYKMINEVSEIHYYPNLKFQDHEIIMRDGNYIFTSVYGINLLNKYYDMVGSYTSEGNKCYYLEDISGNAYTTACPWEPIEEDVQVEDIDEDIEEYE